MSETTQTDEDEADRAAAPSDSPRPLLPQDAWVWPLAAAVGIGAGVLLWQLIGPATTGRPAAITHQPHTITAPRSPLPPAAPVVTPPPAVAFGEPLARARDIDRPVQRADFAGTPAPIAVRKLADWAVDSGDPRGLPFAIIDKRNARLFVFDAAGRLSGAAPVLLGLARGDDSVPGIGERPLARVRPYERTTPAGRFVSEHGRNSKGEDIVWVDYDAAVSMHRVRATNVAERRLERLASRSPADNRISYGCINVPASFYDGVLRTAFATPHAIVYVLPETRSARAVFDSYDVDERKRVLALLTGLGGTERIARSSAGR